jgi:riboflavin kinase / FMN adenylyltransferase
MIVFQGIEELRRLTEPLHLAVGMFDGIHIGHQAVIEACLNTAHNSGGKAGVLTFWPHPSHLLRPDAAVPQIMPLQSKLWTLRRKQLDFAVVQPFSSDLAAIEAEGFMSWLKEGAPSLATLFVGENFRFGKGRSGDVALLRQLAMKVGVHVVSMEHCKVDGESVSSTRIRDLLKSNDFNSIRLLLGHPYSVIGKTIPGRQIGREIGFPTLNIAWDPELKPPFGVYAANLLRLGGSGDSRQLPGVANYGTRPTYGDTREPVLEIHLLAPIHIDYGTEVAVELLQFLRPERRFRSPEDLAVQIAADVTEAKKLFALGSTESNLNHRP